MATDVTKPLKGDDLILLVGTKTQYHATNHTVNLDAEFEEYQTKDTDGKMNVLSGHSGTAQVDGLVCLLEDGDAATTMDTADIIDAFNAGTEVALVLKIKDTTYSTKAWITNVSLTGQVAQNATYSASFKFSKLEPAQ